MFISQANKQKEYHLIYNEILKIVSNHLEEMVTTLNLLYKLFLYNFSFAE